MERKDSLAHQTHKIIYKTGILGHQETTTSSGRISPYYFEFANLLGHPRETGKLARILAYKIEEDQIQYDRIAPVPYTPITLATALSIETEKPLILPREPKIHGNLATVEGPYLARDRILVLEDVLSTGNSALRTVKLLEGYGLVVEDILAVINRNEGAIKLFEDANKQTHILTNVVDTLNYGYLSRPQKVSDRNYERDITFYDGVQRSL